MASTKPTTSLLKPEQKEIENRRAGPRTPDGDTANKTFGGMNGDEDQFNNRGSRNPRDQQSLPATRIISASDEDDTDALPSSLRFNAFDISCIIVSMITYLFDLGMDIFIAYIYYSNHAINYFVITLLFVIIPAVSMTAFSLRWYIMDMDNEDVSKPSYWKWIVRTIFLILQLAPVLRYVDSLLYGLKSRKAKGKGEKQLQLKYYTDMVNEDADATLLRLFEAFMEAAPQVTLQLYIFIVHSNDKEGIGPLGGRDYKIQVIAILSSLVSLAWSLSSYHRSLRYAQPEKANISYKGTILQFLWHFCGISARVLAIGLFASCHPVLIVPVCAVHVLAMVAWLIIQDRHGWANQQCDEILFSLIVAFIYIFTFFNIRDGPSRQNYLIYYIVCFLENLAFMFTWYFSSCLPDSETYSWIRTLALVVHFFMLFLGLLFMLLYYTCFHPTLSRKRSNKTSQMESHKPELRTRTRAEFLTRKGSLDQSQLAAHAIQKSQQTSGVEDGARRGLKKRRSNSCGDALDIPIQRPSHSMVEKKPQQHQQQFDETKM